MRKQGIALFDGDRMSGELNKDESILYLLMLGKKGKSTARFSTARFRC
ncbi:Ger(x)C family spore germination C-terminal domain-containing protein [Brevibacillus sp. MER 51]|nr:Ger(x)C family spore germination C-terminal domain-containing protein [Brevibacillus sp. MER 51]